MTQEDLNSLKWKTEVCPSGTDCWCRVITTEKPTYDDDGNELYIAGAGCIPKVNAEHIVKIHNESLKEKS